MNIDQLRMLLEAVKERQTPVEDALSRLRALPFEQLDFATVDHHRALRCGHPEVIFCPGKSVDQVLAIAQKLSAAGNRVLATRGTQPQLDALKNAFPDSLINPAARAALIHPDPQPALPKPGEPVVAIVSAGTSDSPVAEEAAITLRSLRVPHHRLTDVGVSGLHRLLPHVPILQQCCAVIVIAGMEGALPSVIGGLVACPVYAVPTSVGYGASFNGLTALLAMLNSCSSNVSVVNIDNGFGAAFSAGLVCRRLIERSSNK